MKYFQILEHAYTQTKFWHQQTKSHAEHITLGNFYESLSDLSDQFMEVYYGMNGTVGGNFGMKFQKYSQGCSTRYLKMFIKKLENEKLFLDNGALGNIIDEIVTLSYRTIYLLERK